MSGELLISIDPGVTIGLVIAIMTPNKNLLPLEVYDSRDLCKVLSSVDTVVNSHGAEVVIVEDFVGGGFRSKETKQTIELLGFVKVYYGVVMEQKVVVQQPQFRKHCYNESCSILKERGYKVHHAKDAFAHLIAYCVKEKGYEKKFDLPGN